MIFRIGLLFLLFWIQDVSLLSDEEMLPHYLHYAEGKGANIKELSRRVKRSERITFEDEDDDDPRAWDLPSDVDIQNDTIDHQYYVSNVYNNNTEQLNKYFVDIDEMLKKDGVVGNSSHPMLSKSYRRAVGAKLSFNFPFYGHKMNNLTIATGGFIYIGDHAHNWLAATQYIAPLMANFDTHLKDSKIIYADDGEKFVVEWRLVQLREQSEHGNFTFQVSLMKNGDIVFAYKNIPMDVANISDIHHPVKMGISDAYLFHHIIQSKTSSQPRRIIYEYHRIEVDPSKVTSDSVILLQAQPTCIMYDSCETCSNATLKNFNCSWCHSRKKNGGPFCTDQSGLHRKRQHWIENNCKDQGKSIYCKGKTEDYEEKEDTENDDDSTEKSSTLSPSSSSSPTTIRRSKFLDDNVNESISDKSKVVPAQSGSGFALLVVFLGSMLCLIGWVAYAYYNPHSASGQLLIKYRPSKWSVPNSHVRYSASVHM